MSKNLEEITVNYQKYVLRIPLIALTAGLSTLATQKAIASEINFGDQINTQTQIGNYDKKLPKWDSTYQYSIAQRNRSLEEFCKDYPLNSRCAEQEVIDTDNNTQQTDPATDDLTQVRGDNWAILTNASTLGLGGAIVAKINPNLNARVGINAFSFDLTYEETRASYDSEVNLFNVLTALDYYPAKNSGFHASLGVVYTNNNADGVATASDIIDDVDLGAFNIAVDDLLDVNADVSTSRNFAPYIGIGWGNPIAGGLRFWANVGVMFPGSPDVDLSPNFQIDENLISDEIRQDIQEGIEEEERDIEDELEGFNIFPIVSIGLSYSF